MTSISPILAESQEVLNGEAGVFEDTNGKPTAQITAGVDGDRDGNLPALVPESQMASGLRSSIKACDLRKRTSS